MFNTIKVTSKIIETNEYLEGWTVLISSQKGKSEYWVNFNGTVAQGSSSNNVSCVLRDVGISNTIYDNYKKVIEEGLKKLFKLNEKPDGDFVVNIDIKTHLATLV